MRFAISTAFQPVDHLIPLARAADELGYHSIAVPDHVVDLEELATPYPYTAGRRPTLGPRRRLAGPVGADRRAGRGDHAAAVPHLGLRAGDPQPVPGRQERRHGRRAVGQPGQPGRRDRLVPRGVRAARAGLLHPRQAHRRGAGADGRAVEAGLDASSRATFYTAPRLVMEPTPTEPIPIIVGGLSDIAFRRAARHDGWVGDLYSIEEATAIAARLAAARAEIGAEGDFSVITALNDAFLPEHFERAEAGGVTDCWTMPWAYYYGLDATPGAEARGDGALRRRRAGAAERLSASGRRASLGHVGEASQRLDVAPGQRRRAQHLRHQPARAGDGVLLDHDVRLGAHRLEPDRDLGRARSAGRGRAAAAWSPAPTRSPRWCRRRAAASCRPSGGAGPRPPASGRRPRASGRHRPPRAGRASRRRARPRPAPVSPGSCRVLVAMGRRYPAGLARA